MLSVLVARQDNVPHPASPSNISFTSFLSTGPHHAHHRGLCPHAPTRRHQTSLQGLLPTPSHHQTSHHTNYHLTRYCPAPQGNVPLPHQLITFPDIADTMYSFPDCNPMLYRIPFPGHALQLLTQTPLHFGYLWLWCGTRHFKVWW